jgi:putative membrane protein
MPHYYTRTLAGSNTGLEWLFLIICFAVFVLTLLALTYFILRYNKSISNGSGEDTSLRIIKERYAKGEITKDQFDQMKKDLK